jgi:hypothetical protein
MSTPDYYLLPDGREFRTVVDNHRAYIYTALVYLFRAGHKDNEPMVKDLKKARDYVRFELERKEPTEPCFVPPQILDVVEFMGDRSGLDHAMQYKLERAFFDAVLGDCAGTVEEKEVFFGLSIKNLTELINSLEAQNE